MVKQGDALSLILMTASICLLITSVHLSIIQLFRNTVSLNLNAVSLGVFSTLNPAYAVGLILIIASALLAKSRVLRGIALTLLVTYLAGYTMLLSPYPAFYVDAVTYSHQSTIVSKLMFFSRFGSMIYNGGLNPTAFTWEATILDVIRVPALNISAAYGLLEPILLSLVSLAVAIRLSKLSKGINAYYVITAVVAYTALIWSYQLHFCPQDFNIMIYALTIPPLLIVINNSLDAVAMLGIVVAALTIGHPTEIPLLFASSIVMLILTTRRLNRLFLKPAIALIIALTSALAWMSYNAYVFIINVPILTYLITPQALWRLLTLIVNPFRLINAWISMIEPNAYPLRYLINLIDIYGGFILELTEAVVAVILIVGFMVRGIDNDAEPIYASIALGGVIVTIALTLVFLIMYSDRMPIYTAPVLGGLIAYHLNRRLRRGYLALAILIPMSLLSLLIAGSILYWEYGYADPVSYASNALLQGLHMNGTSCSNNNNVFTIATYSMHQYIEVVNSIHSSSIVYYDGIDYCTLNS